MSTYICKKKGCGRQRSWKGNRLQAHCCWNCCHQGSHSPACDEREYYKWEEEDTAWPPRKRAKISLKSRECRDPDVRYIKTLGSFQLQSAILRHKKEVIRFLTDRLKRDGNVKMPQEAMNGWTEVAAWISSMHRDPEERTIKLYAVKIAEHATVSLQIQHGIDLTKYSGIQLNHTTGIAVGSVSGVSEHVQNVAITQPETTQAMRHAIEMIEYHDAMDLAVYCQGATHRSVAFCFLLATIVYPNAQITLTTLRTISDAEEYGHLG